MIAVAEFPVQYGQVIDVTDFVRQGAGECGFITVMVKDSRAAIFLSSTSSETDRDICTDMERAFPARCSYSFQKSPAHTSAAVISAVMGSQQSIPYKQGRLLLGDDQSVRLIYMGDRDSVQLSLMNME